MLGFCPGIRVHKGIVTIITIVFSLFKAIPFFFFRFLSNAFSDFGSVGRKRKKKNKNKIEKKSGARWPGTSA